MKFDYDKDVALISQVLNDIVDEFLLKERLKFNIMTFGRISQLQKEILSNFMAQNIGEKFVYKLLGYNILVPTNDGLFQSNILVLESLNNFEYIWKWLKIIRYHNQPIKYFVLVPYLTFEELKVSWIHEVFEVISIYSDDAFLHSYFITNEMDTVTLSTVEWFSPYRCGHPYLNKLNTFNKKLLSWNLELTNYEKFLTYHGCELVLLIPAVKTDGTVDDVSGYAIVNRNSTDFLVRGLAPVVYEIASKFHNFTIGYQPAELNDSWFDKLQDKPINLIKINDTEKVPHLILQTWSLHTVDFVFIRTSNVIENLNIRILFTPSEKFTPYEKFFLPFDLGTWILLATTFLLTFMSILIINRLSKSTQILVYGNKVDTPIWNVISIFFGISQTKLPSKNFSRFILIIFIYFCLIFRTCFQSKFFEFLTSEPRQLPPKSVKDLILRNYNVFAIIENAGFISHAIREGEW